MKTRVLLIDGDIICYKSAAAAQKTKVILWDGPHVVGEYKNITEAKELVENWQQYETTIHVDAEPEHHAFYNVKRAIGAMEEKFYPCDIVVCLSDSPTLRDFIGTVRKYKGHRDPSLKPRHLKACHEYLRTYYSTCTMKNLEADDALGILNSRIKGEGDLPVVCSTDKDLDQLPGSHYNFDKDILYDISEREGYIKLISQHLSGDSTDNIPGIEGIGPKTADMWAVDIHTRLPRKDWYKAVENKYVEKYGWNSGPARCRETWFLVKICRSEEDAEELRTESQRVSANSQEVAG